MIALENDLYIKAALGEETSRTPVWMMRQAGRYLPEYRATRAKAGDFMSLCQNPELACEVTMQPLERYAFDAAILFSDILTVPDAMGLELYFTAGEGPAFKKPIGSMADINKLGVIDPNQELSYVMKAVSTIRTALNGKVPLIGFSGSPWTLATYMVEGGPTKNFSKVKGMMFSDPKAMHQLLGILADSVANYLNGQVEAGAQALMIFDTWGGVLSKRDYLAFSLAYMTRVVEQLKREKDGQRIPVTLFSKDGGQWLAEMAGSGCDCLGVDWTTDLKDARQSINNKVALQGNMDPCVLYASEERIRNEVANVLASYGRGNGHIFNLGHGIHPGIEPSKVGVFVNAVHELSPQYHQ